MSERLSDYPLSFDFSITPSPKFSPAGKVFCCQTVVLLVFVTKYRGIEHNESRLAIAREVQEIGPRKWLRLGTLPGVF